VPKGLKYSLESITPEQLEDLQVVIREQTASSLAYVADSYDPLIVASAYLSIVRQIYMLYLKKEEAETLFEWAKINMDPKTKEAHLH
jgi:hypothetical protein